MPINQHRGSDMEAMHCSLMTIKWQMCPVSQVPQMQTLKAQFGLTKVHRFLDKEASVDCFEHSVARPCSPYSWWAPRWSAQARPGSCADSPCSPALRTVLAV